jgi:hypothetical protein
MVSAERIVKGQKPTEEEVFYADAGDQLIKDSLPFLNQVLRQLVTLTAALFIGAAALFDKRLLEKPAIIAAMLVMLFALGIALVGILPFGDRINRRQPGLIYKEMKRAIGYKSWLAWTAAVALFISLAILGIGIIAANP